MSPTRVLALASALLALTLTQACTRATAAVNEPQAVTVAPSTATAAPSSTPTETPEPTAIPTPTATLDPAMLQSKYLDMACRFGYGTAWSQEGLLLRQTPVPILGRNEDSTWWNITNPHDDGTTCWVPALQTAANGNLSAVPIKAQPEAIVGHVTVDIDPNEETIACFAFPFEFIVQTTIGVTGPTHIQLRRSDSVNGSRPSATLTLDRGRNWVILDRIRVNDPSEVWFLAEVSGPNTIAAQASASVDCVASGP
jgi:hypothetical protein